ncbi:sigma-54-dependent Fis family transcriptional regulator [Pseudobacillus sp. FSL P4-0506]|uniref:sigma-54-dependent Fis family transcriptional regulator n=1 Tax=unclassified Pseudobacillus TaxID=2619284 RepID=UPI0030F7BF1B
MIRNALNDKQTWLKYSWRRCQDLGFDRNGKPIFYQAEGNLLKELLEKNERLIRASEAVFRQLDQFLKDYHYRADLLDHEGYILHSYGVISEPGLMNNPALAIGTCWGETFRGTNAVSFSIEHKMPVNIHGSEHFFLENQVLTCSASPIFDEAGQVTAVVNFSSRSSNIQDNALIMAMLAADAIGYRLLTEHVKVENELLIRETEKLSSSHSQGIVTVNADSHIIYANKKAKKLLGNNCIGTVFNPSSLHTESIYPTSGYCSRRSYMIKPHTSARKSYTFDRMIAECPKVKQVIQLSQRAAATDFSLFIHGESGTGKELFAQSVHQASMRADKPFVAVNCSALAKNLIESELFGYKKGAFTGADHAGSLGKFRAADGGTLFLDEIGDMPLQAQSALLRVLEEREVMPVGDHQTYPVDVRIIAATHRNLLEETKKGSFRADLYYRLNEICLNIPPLRERGDIIQLARHFLTGLSGRSQQFTNEAENMLLSYDWPGNVRELKNVVTQASFLADGRWIDTHHLKLQTTPKRASTVAAPSFPPSAYTLEEAEKLLIEQALKTHNSNISQAAKQLGISRNTLYRKLKAYEYTE